MRKDEIIRHIAEETDLPQVVVEEVVNATLDEVKSALQRGDSVTLRRFGSFHVRDKSARTGRNPKTLQEAPIPPRRVVRFKTGKQFKAAVSASSSQSAEPTA